MIKQVFRELKEVLPLEKVGKGNVIQWGEDNLYPQFLTGLYYDNPIHQGIINQKVKFITSGGIEVQNGDEKILNNYGGAFTLQEIYERMALDYELFEAWAVLFRKSTKGWVAHPIDMESIRKTENDIYYFVSDDWSKANQGTDTGFKTVKNIMYITGEETECIMMFQTPAKQRLYEVKGKKKLTLNYYPQPGYSITPIRAGIEMDYFTLSEVVNGYKGGTLINLANGIPESDTEADKIAGQIKGDATDRDKQGGVTVTFSNGKDNEPTVHQLSGNDLDKRYIESSKEILRKIMVAHGVISPALFGVLSETMFGGKEEMETAYVLFQENYCTFRQRNLLEPLTWAESKLNGFQGELVAKPYQLTLEQNVIDDGNRVAQALNSMSPLVATKVLNVLTTNEIRRLGGLPPIEGGDVVSTPVTTFSKEDDQAILDLFSKCGRSKEGVKVVYSRSFDYETSDIDCFTRWKTGSYAELSSDQTLILKMIEAGEDYKAINTAVGKGGVYLSKQLISLEKSGHIDGWSVTDKGLKEIVEETQIEVLYSYETRPDAPPLVKGGESRPFCQTLEGSNKYFTRTEIDQISAQVDRDVWRYRGGWYHNPESGKNTPSCRHEWRQYITIK